MDTWNFAATGVGAKRIQGIGSGCFLPCGKGCDKVFNNLCEYLIPFGRREGGGGNDELNNPGFDTLDRVCECGGKLMQSWWPAAGS